MKKSLLLLLGLLLIALLTYFCFTSKQESIKQDLIVNTKSALGKQSGNIDVGIKGSKFWITRIITLKGTVFSKEDKAKAEELAKDVKGVDRVDNQLIVAVPIPSPYTLSATKSKDNVIILDGYVSNVKVHQKLIAEAKALFGEDKVTDNLKESKGAPTAWFETSKLALDKLKDVDYGEFIVSDSDFSFKGYIGSEDAKKRLLSEFNDKLNSEYKGNYVIDTPKPKVVETIVKNIQNTNVQNQITICKSQIDDLLSSEKIHFEQDKATIKQNSYELLVSLMEVINKCPDTIVTIEGYTDSDGNTKYNKQLSQKRADVIKEYLENRGIAKERLRAIGYGESKPIASNATKDGKQKNRRIEFKFKGVE